MQYRNVVQAKFLTRPNRFIALVEINGREEVVHVKNTGRCRELLLPGCKVYLERAANPDRKTKYDLIAVEKERPGLPPLLINMDSQIPNQAAEEWLKSGALFSQNAIIKREVTYHNSRFDFFLTDGDRKAFLEVKGVTLESHGIASFPDAPTERGVKHLQELSHCLLDGYDSYLLFVIQMQEITGFRPNDVMHPDFGKSLRAAQKNGVQLLAMDCDVTPDSIMLRKPVPIVL